MLANVGLVPRVPSHPNPLPGGARGLTERVDSICRPDKAFTPHPAVIPDLYGLRAISTARLGAG